MCASLIASTNLWPQETFTFLEMLAMVVSGSSFGAYVCLRRPVGLHCDQRFLLSTSVHKFQSLRWFPQLLFHCRVDSLCCRLTYIITKSKYVAAHSQCTLQFFCLSIRFRKRSQTLKPTLDLAHGMVSFFTISLKSKCIPINSPSFFTRRYGSF